MNSIKISLVLRNPYEVYEALLNNDAIKRWHKFIADYYLPPQEKRVLLFYPCSAKKPYTMSRSYRMLFKTLKKLGEKRSLIHVVTVSEPFALVPEEFYNKNSKWHNWKDDWYDCPGLFEWWCRSHGEPYDRYYVEKCLDIISNVVASFLKRLKAYHLLKDLSLIGFVKTYSSSLRITLNNTHRIILERAMKKSNTSIILLPTKSFVKSLIKRKGRVAWDFYGVAHPESQKYLLRKLQTMLKPMYERNSYISKPSNH